MNEILRATRKEKMLDLDSQLRQEVAAATPGEIIICPLCRYIGKNKRGTAKVFQDNTFKCFSCGIWRRLG